MNGGFWAILPLRKKKIINPTNYNWKNNHEKHENCLEKTRDIRENSKIRENLAIEKRKKGVCGDFRGVICLIYYNKQIYMLIIKNIFGN